VIAHVLVAAFLAAIALYLKAQNGDRYMSPGATSIRFLILVVMCAGEQSDKWGMRTLGGVLIIK